MARWLRPLRVPAAYAVVALLMSWPLALHFTTHIPHGGDALQFPWGMWWYREVAESGLNPFHTSLLYYPYGVSLLFATLAPFVSILTVPLQWMGLDLVTCYNLLVLLSSVIGACAVWALARRLTGSSAAAFVAGLVYGWSPYHSAHLIGHLNLVSHQWMPVYMLALLHVLDRVWPAAPEEGWHGQVEHGRPWRWALVAALAAVATALTEWTYAAFLVIWSVVYVLYRSWPLLRRRQWSLLFRAIGPLMLLGGLVLLLIAPLLLPMVRELRTSSYMIPDTSETLNYSADVMLYLLPSELHPLLTARMRAAMAELASLPFLAERVVTLGYTVPMLVIAALLLRRRARGVRFWGWSLAIFAILSVGPVLRIMGKTSWTAFDTGVLMPYAVLYRIPGFAVSRTPIRFAVLVSLSGAVLAAYGLVALQQRWNRGQRLLIPLAGILILAEYWAPPALAFPPQYPTAMAMRDDPQPGAVLNLPLRPMVDYLWYQTKHGRPIVGGFLPRQPPDRFASEHPVMVYLQATTPITAATTIRDGAGVRLLRQAGVRYVVVHWWATDDYRPALERKLGILFAQQQPRENGIDQTSTYLIPTE